MRVLSLLALLCCAAIGQAQAAAIFLFTETGGNLVGTLSGTLDLSGATANGNTPSYNARISTRFGFLNASPGDCCDSQGTVYELASASGFRGVSGPSVFGTAVGDVFEISDTRVIVPLGYAGGSLRNTITFANTSLSALGIAAGDYVYTLTGSGDTVTLRFGGGATGTVPLPGTAALAVLGFLGLAASRRQKRSGVL